MWSIRIKIKKVKIIDNAITWRWNKIINIGKFKT